MILVLLCEVDYLVFTPTTYNGFVFGKNEAESVSHVCQRSEAWFLMPRNKAFTLAPFSLSRQNQTFFQMAEDPDFRGYQTYLKESVGTMGRRAALMKIRKLRES